MSSMEDYSGQLAKLFKAFKNVDSSTSERRVVTFDKIASLLASDWAKRQGLSLHIPLSFTVQICSSVEDVTQLALCRASLLCLEALLSLPVSQVVVARPDGSAKLISSLVKCVNALLPSVGGGNGVQEVVVMATHSIDCLGIRFIDIVNHHGNMKRVFEVIHTTLLPPMMSLWFQISSTHTDHHNLSATLKAISSILVSKAYLNEYQRWLSMTKLSDIKMATTSKGEAYVGTLFHSLHKQLKDSCLRKPLLHFVPLLFEMFLESNGRSKVVKKVYEFSMLAQLSAILGYHGDLTHTTHEIWKDWEEESVSTAVTSLAACLHLAVTYQVYQPSEDSGAQLIWLQGLCDSLVNEQRVHLMRGFYSLLSAMLDLCHSSVEPQIPKIWRTFLEQKDTLGEDFCCRVVKKYSKLHQVNKLVAMVKEGVSDAVWVECKSLFKLKCGPVFEKAVSTTPPGQCSELLQFVCGWTADECSALLKSINPEGREEAPQKKKRKTEPSFSVPPRQVNKAVSVCELCSLILPNTPLSVWKKSRFSSSSQDVVAALTSTLILQLMESLSSLQPDSPLHSPLSACLLFLFLGVYKMVAAGAIGDKFLSDISSQDLQLIATTPLTHFLFSHVVVLDVLSDRPTNFDILMMPTPWSEAEGAWWDGDVFSIGQSEGSEVVACLELLLGGLHHLGDERMLEHVSRVICWVLVNCCTQPHVSECKTLMSVTRKFLMSHDYHMMNKLHTFLATHLCQFVADSKDFHTLDGSRVDSSLAKPVEELLSVCASYLSRECGPSGVVGVGRDQSTFVSGMLEVVHLIPLHSLPDHLVERLITSCVLIDIKCFNIPELNQLLGNVRTVCAYLIEYGGRKGISPQWYEELLRWAWLTGDQANGDDVLLCSSLALVQTLIELIPNMEDSYIVDVIEDLYNPLSTCHDLFLQVIVHQLCQVLSMSQGKKGLKENGKKVLCCYVGLFNYIHGLIPMGASSEGYAALCVQLWRHAHRVIPSTELSKEHIIDCFKNSLSYLNGDCDDVTMTTNCVDLLAVSVLASEDSESQRVKGAWRALLQYRKRFCGSDGQCRQTVKERVEEVTGFILSQCARSELKDVFEGTFELVRSGSPAADDLMVFLECWDVVLRTTLSDEGKREMRRWMSRVALSCAQLVSSHSLSTPDQVLTLALSVLHRLASYPAHVGMDKQTVMVILHAMSVPDGCVPGGRVPDGCVQDERGLKQVLNDAVFLCTMSLAEVLMLLWRHYKDVVCGDFVSVMSIVRNVLAIITRGVKEEIVEASLLKKCCSNCVLMAEMVSKDKEKLSKYCPYLVLDLLKALQSCSPPPVIKGVLHLAVYHLLDACEAHDMVFLKSSLNFSQKDLFDTIYTNFEKYHKFSGQT